MKQRGVTLAVTLILLFLLTLIGLTGFQVSQMQEKMSSNLQEKGVALNAAESAINEGETWIQGLTTQPSVVVSCTAPCVLSTLQNIDFTTQTDTWWQSTGATYSKSLNQVKTAPRYVIEFLQFVPDSPVLGDSSIKGAGVHYYQVTAKGSGGSDDSASILQTTIGRRY